MNKLTLEKNWKRSLASCVVAVLVSMTITQVVAGSCPDDLFEECDGLPYSPNSEVKNTGNLKNTDTSVSNGTTNDDKKPAAPLTKSK